MAAGIFFFFFFLFGNKKFLGLGEILCATAVPRGSPAPPAPSPSFASCGRERGRGTFWARVNVRWRRAISCPPHTWKKKTEKGQGGDKCQQGDTPIHCCSLAQVGRSGQPQQPSPAGLPLPPPPGSLLKLQLIGYFGGNVFEGHGGA